ncbi:MAG: hypothetical protein KDC07_02565 [Chitinophagaceae bacterium]|nr:hypothetical protein [Chitinophagaceae bacterium]MCB9045637.1 hypothetical protein [Chitinophagales bacterium]
MIHKVFLVLCFTFMAYCGSAQGLQNFDFYYGHSQVSQEAKEYYAHLFDVNSSNKAYSILDSVFTQNDETRPFYIFLICRMLKEARGEMLIELNIICRHAAEMYPNSLIPVLYAGKNYVDEDVKDLWASRMATEIRVTCNGELMNCFKDSRSTALQHCDTYNKGRLESLYNFIRKDLNLFQQR